MFGRIVTRILAYIGALALIMMVSLGIIIWRIGTPSTPDDDALLTLQIDGSLAESAGAGTDLFTPRLTIRQAVAALERAAHDPNIRGLYVEVIGGGTGIAEAQELGEAVERVRAAGKPTLLWADTLGELEGATGQVLLASYFERVLVQPGGGVGLTGLSLETPFLRRFLDSYGIVPDYGRRRDFKTLADSFTETGLTEANRTMLTSLVDTLTAQTVETIARNRKLNPAAVRQMLDAGGAPAAQAAERKLIDGVLHRDEARAEADKIGVPYKLADYAARLSRDAPSNAPQIAVITIAGVIQRGREGIDLFSGEPSAGATILADRFDRATADGAVKAVIIRIDSPGGSAVASETIRRGIDRLKAAGKRVVVSMGPTAGSGGYWVALGADRIVAAPGTLTGSIGVVGGKLAFGGLLGTLGIAVERIQQGQTSGMFSLATPFSEAERARLEAWLDQVYGDFTAKVAATRGLKPEEVEAAAQGRVWTGAQAVELKLVDRAGGFAVALDEVRQLLQLEAGHALNLIALPPDRSPVDALLGGLLGGEDRSPVAILQGLRGLGIEADLGGAALRAATAIGQPRAGALVTLPVLGD